MAEAAPAELFLLAEAQPPPLSRKTSLRDAGSCPLTRRHSPAARVFARVGRFWSPPPGRWHSPRRASSRVAGSGPPLALPSGDRWHPGVPCASTRPTGVL